MKKYVVFIFAILLLSGCQKEEVVQPLPSQSHIIVPLKVEWQNPFDEENEGILTGISEFGALYFEDELPEYPEYYETFCEYINQYWDYNETYEIGENSMLQYWFRYYMQIALDNENSLLDGLTEAEVLISENGELGTSYQQCLLYNFSVIRTSLSGLKTLTGGPSWDDLFDNCIHAQLNAVFGNPVSSIEFIVGLPFSWYWLSAACAYSATIEYYS